MVAGCMAAGYIVAGHMAADQAVAGMAEVDLEAVQSQIQAGTGQKVDHFQTAGKVEVLQNGNNVFRQREPVPLKLVCC